MADDLARAGWQYEVGSCGNRTTQVRPIRVKGSRHYVEHELARVMDESKAAIKSEVNPALFDVAEGRRQTAPRV
jgi:hypothetical protein